MISQDHKLLRRLDRMTPPPHNLQHIVVMTERGSLSAESISMFEEATQTTVGVLSIPICILGLIQAEHLSIQAAVGLSQLKNLDELATGHQLQNLEPFCSYVVNNRQTLAITDTLTHSAFADSALVKNQGIRAYLGVPLITFDEYCLGTLAVMDVTPRSFTQQDIEFLRLMARWSMSEFERQQTTAKLASPPPPRVSQPTPANAAIANQLQVDLLSELVEELRTPLTSVMGMTSVLTHEVYGPLTSKQKEYLNIIHTSGQYLLSLVNEIVDLSQLKKSNQGLNLALVDVEMLCQQVINSLEQAVQRCQQQIRLTLEPGRRIWLLDKEKVRQIVYYLIFSVVQSSTAGSVIRLHASQRDCDLSFSVWTSHPWLGEGLPFAEIYSLPVEPSDVQSQWKEPSGNQKPPAAGGLNGADSLHTSSMNSSENSSDKNLGLLLSQHLAELHGGQLAIQGTTESGYRYVVTLPRIDESGRNL